MTVGAWQRLHNPKPLPKANDHRETDHCQPESGKEKVRVYEIKRRVVLRFANPMVSRSRTETISKRSTKAWLRRDVRVVEITAFKQQRFTGFLCERIGKAVAEIEFCRMPTTLSKISISASCDLRLSCRDRLD